MAHRLDGHDPVRPGHLSFIVAPYRLVESPGKLCGLDVGPGEILVAVSPVPVSRHLPVGCPGALHAPAVRRVIAYRGEAIDMAHLEHDREAEDLPYAGHGEEFYELLSDLELLHRQLLDPVDCFFQMADEIHTGHDRGAHLLVGKERRYLSSRKLLDLVAFHPDPEVPREDVLDAQDMGCPVADELEPFS